MKFAAFFSLLLLARTQAQTAAGLGSALLGSLNQAALQNTQAWLLNSLKKMDAVATEVPVASVADSVDSGDLSPLPSVDLPPVVGSNLTLRALQLGNATYSAFSVSTDTLATLVDSVKSQFCTKPVFKPGHRAPARIKGPEMKVTVDFGNCSIIEELHGKAIACSEPSVSYIKKPISYVSKHFMADKLVTEECAVGKRHGEPTEVLLYGGGHDMVFDSIEEFIGNVSRGAKDLGIGSWANSWIQSQVDAYATLAAEQGAAEAAAVQAGQQAFVAPQSQPAAAAQQTVAAAKTVVPGGWKVVMRTSAPSPSVVGEQQDQFFPAGGSGNQGAWSG